MKKADLKLIPFDGFLRKQKKKNSKVRKSFSNPEPEINLAFNLARLRIQKGFNQTLLAKRAGVSRSVIFYIEDCNLKHKVTIRVVNKLAKALGVPFTDFFQAVDLNMVASGR